jgi:hypothetical protein
VNQAEAQEAKRVLEANRMEAGIRAVTHNFETYWLEWFDGDYEAGLPVTVSSLREAEEAVADNYCMSWDEWKKQQTTPS